MFSVVRVTVASYRWSDKRTAGEIVLRSFTRGRVVNQKLHEESRMTSEGRAAGEGGYVGTVPGAEQHSAVY